MDKKQYDYLKDLLSYVTANYEDEVNKIYNNCDDLNHLFHLDEYYIKSFGCKDQVAEFVRLVAALNSRRNTDKFKIGKKYLQKDIENYICALFFGYSVETIFMLMFDKDEKFIGCECLGDGTVNSSGFLPRKMIDVAMRKNCTSVVLAHNHPLGVTSPSGNDIVTTSLTKSVLTDAGIKLLAHYIVSGSQIADCLPSMTEHYEEPSKVFKVASKQHKI